MDSREPKNDFDKELRNHLDLEAEENSAEGISAREAQDRARRAFGNSTIISEDVRAVWHLQWLEDIWQHAHYGFRQLRKNPGFAIVAVLTLALGIGANTAIFTLLDSVLLQNLPVRDPASLYLLGRGESHGFMSGISRAAEIFSVPFYEELRKQGVSFAETCAFSSSDPEFTLRLPKSQHTEVAKGKLVSGSYFDVLGVNMLLGRPISSEDDSAPGTHPVAVISYRFWSARFGGASSALGATLDINGAPFTIIGVAPREFFGETEEAEPPDIWFPLAMTPQIIPKRELLSTAGTFWLDVMGRLRPGVTPAQAAAETTALYHQYLNATIPAASLSADDRTHIAQSHVDVTPGGPGISRVRKRYSTPLHLLMGMVGAILLIACLNIANLLLARADVRAAEISVRVALGAPRTRLIRQLLTESMLLALIGGGFGLLIAAWSSSALVTLAFGPDQRLPTDSVLSAHILEFAFAVCVASGIAFGLVPAFRASRNNAVAGIKTHGHGTGHHRGRISLPRALIVAQVALSLTLIVSSALFLHSLVRLEIQDFGFDSAKVITAHINPQISGYKLEELPALYSRILEKIRALPGVDSASLSLYAPMMDEWSSGISAEPVAPDAAPFQEVAWWNRVTPEFFSTLGMRIRAGRSVTAADGPDAPKIAVVNESFARKFFGGASPLGRRFSWDKNESEIEIVGVVSDAKFDDPRSAPPAMFYIPMFQRSGAATGADLREQTVSMYATDLEVRTIADASAMERSLGDALGDVAPNLQVTGVERFADVIALSLTQERLITNLAAAFGILALVIACVGLYGLMSYLLARRTREFGLRKALGAQTNSILRLALGSGATLIAAGVALGLAGAYATTRLFASMLYKTPATDWLSYLLGAGLLTCVGLLAAYLPARRAARMNPMIALRNE
jgi:predicted permease